MVVEESLDREPQEVGGDGLGEERKRAGLHGLNLPISGCVARHEDARQIGFRLTYRPNHLDSAHSGHVDVHDRECEPSGLPVEDLQRRQAGFGLEDVGKPVASEKLTNGLPHRGVIVREQYSASTAGCVVTHGRLHAAVTRGHDSEPQPSRGSGAEQQTGCQSDSMQTIAPTGTMNVDLRSIGPVPTIPHLATKCPGGSGVLADPKAEMTIRHIPGSRSSGAESADRAGATPPRSPEAAALYLIVDPRDPDGAGDDLGRLRAAFGGGVQWAQLRMKGARTEELVDVWRRLVPIADEAGVLLVMNDDPVAAVRVGAPVVHLGQSDLEKAGGTIEAVRRTVGDTMRIGVSTHSEAQARLALSMGADYIGIGAMFPTSSKDAATVIGPSVLSLLSDLDRSQPIYPIGGIDLGNVSQITERGINRVAVSSAILHAADPGQAASEFRAALRPVGDPT